MDFPPDQQPQKIDLKTLPFFPKWAAAEVDPYPLLEKADEDCMQPPTAEEIAEANKNAEGGEDPKKNIRKKTKAQFKRPAKFVERLAQEEEDDKEEKPTQKKQEDDMSALGFMGTRLKWRRGTLPLYFWDHPRNID